MRNTQEHGNLVVVAYLCTQSIERIQIRATKVSVKHAHSTVMTEHDNGTDAAGEIIQQIQRNMDRFFDSGHQQVQIMWLSIMGFVNAVRLIASPSVRIARS